MLIRTKNIRPKNHLKPKKAKYTKSRKVKLQTRVNQTLKAATIMKIACSENYFVVTPPKKNKQTNKRPTFF